MKPACHDPNPRPLHRPTLTALAGTLARSVSLRSQITALVVIAAVALTEGAGLAMLGPLLAVVSGQGHEGWISSALTHALSAIGMPVSMPILLALFFGIVAFRAFCLHWRDIVLFDLSVELTSALRKRLFDAISQADWPFVANERLSRLNTIMSADMETVGQGTIFLLRIPAILATGALQTALALSLSPGLTIGALACGAAIAIAIRKWRGEVYWPSARLAENRRIVFDRFRDLLDSLKLTKSHQTEDRHRAAFQSALSEQTAQSRRLVRGVTDSRALLQIGAAAALVVLIYCGSVVAGLEATELAVVVAVFARFVPLAAEWRQAVDFATQTLPAFGEVSSTISRAERAQRPTDASDARMELNRELRIADLNFRYDRSRGPDVLHDLNLVIPARSIVAIVGATGAGKTTLADIMAGLLSPDAGQVSIDGPALDRDNIPTWQRSIAYVPQDNFLFNDTIRANLLWSSPNASEDELNRVLALTGADGFIAMLPKGLDTSVGERGSQLSGGERQRIALARALLRRPTLIILDEATNALDNASENVVAAGLRHVANAPTVVIVTHRTSLAQQADRVFKLENGTIVASPERAPDAASASAACPKPAAEIPFFLPDIGPDEIRAVTECLKSGWLTTGSRTADFERDFASFVGGGVEAVAVSSATAGLEIALTVHGIGAGDEVITSDYTFTATAMSIAHVGATPVLVDIDPLTFNLDPDKVEAAITSRTKAIIPVHFAGLACDMGAIRTIAARHRLKIVEDAAHAFPATWQGQMIGQASSDATAFSFYASKTITTGEGGMVTFADPEIGRHAKVVRLHGISKDIFSRNAAGRAWFYDVITPGFKANMSDIVASIGVVQLRRANEFHRCRAELWSAYDEALADLPVVLPPKARAGDVHAMHLYALRLRDEAPLDREQFLVRMAEAGIHCSVHFIPIHRLSYWRDSLGLDGTMFPNAEKAFQQEVTLPLFNALRGEKQQYIIDTIRRLLGQ